MKGKGSEPVKIAVADDQLAARQAAEKQIREYLSANHPQVVEDLEISSFESAEELLKSYYQGKYDLLILDIYMADMTGMEAAEVIRLSDESVPIVFLTTSTDHLLDGYRVFAAGYLLKPLAEHVPEFSRTMKHIFPELLQKQKSINFLVKGEEMSILLKKIKYVDIDHQHKLCVHLSDVTLRTTMTYVDCQAVLLAEKNFLECHHRIIINMDYVQKMEKDRFVLLGETKIPISQRRSREAKAAYMHYLVQR